MEYQISDEPNPKPEDIQVLNDGISDQAKEKKGMQPLGFHAFFIRDQNKKIIGGCNTCHLYGCLYIDQLWLSEPLRGKGYGKHLMQKAESFAKEIGCRFMAVNTFDWEALGFYKKQGFTIEFERTGFDKNSIFYFLRKNLT